MSKFTALQTEVGFLIMDMGLKPRPIREISNPLAKSPPTLLYSLALPENNVKIKILFIDSQEYLKPLFPFFTGSLREFNLYPATRLTGFQSCINYAGDLECVTTRGRRGAFALS